MDGIVLAASLRKVATALLTLLISSFIIFAAMRLVPGDPVLALSAGRRLSAVQLAALRHEYGLDQPFLTSYLHWLGGVLHLDFGTSLVYQSSVGSLIGSRLAVSGLLIVYAAVLTIVVGFGAAILGVARGGAIDQAVVYLSGLATATPPFLSAIVLLSVFSVSLGWFPALGAGQGFGDRLYHFTLPAVALAFSSVGVLARLGRASFAEQQEREHVEVARSRGVPAGRVLRRHVVRPALGTVLTLVALLFASLFVGTAVVETAFGLDGVGSLLVTSVSRRDMPVVQAIALFGVTLFVVTSTLVELVLPLIDPRLKATAVHA
ncbi:MAG: ABC transporter permease [Nocardioides sp.]|uniref:ABC transporter permease n=1 Tax=Nocardioides sp. TaxID=35761 RepID=UPI0039E26919